MIKGLWIGWLIALVISSVALVVFGIVEFMFGLVALTILNLLMTAILGKDG